jgi:hypothetical protein
LKNSPKAILSFIFVDFIGGDYVSPKSRTFYRPDVESMARVYRSLQHDKDALQRFVQERQQIVTEMMQVNAIAFVSDIFFFIS